MARARESQPRLYMGQLRSTDNESYNLPNSGCPKATAYIREHYPLVEESSLCLECVFKECYFDHENRGQGGRPKKSV